MEDFIKQGDSDMTRMLTPHEIAELAEPYNGLANIRKINELYRAQDESHLWPVCGRFDATERAIRRAREYRRESGPCYGLEYALLVDSMLSEIVNQEI